MEEGNLIRLSPLRPGGGGVLKSPSSGKSTRGFSFVSEIKLRTYSEKRRQEWRNSKQNTTYGFLVGPFGSVEDSILEWSPEKRRGTCDRKGAFARLVWSRKFVLIFHELSMTGAPLAMMELATEFLSCGATISVIVLNKKGGLMTELTRRKIKVLEDKTDLSFKTAMKADLIIAGSAVCSSWIVKKLIFLSESQSKQWLTWCEEENIQLNSEPALVPLSVNDELAFVAGISSSLNTPSFTTEKMLEKRQLLRSAVRKEMGLSEDDMLAVTLSSINPGKGQLLILESARLMIERGTMMNNTSAKDSILIDHDYYYSRALLQNTRKKEEKLKILIGSVGSKSNKVMYVKTLLRYLSTHSNLSKSVLWTPATTRVASLYAAADVYIMNSQGLGETFGRVTIEAMAFGLPIYTDFDIVPLVVQVLGTDSGGTKEIVEHNVTGLLHPLGRPGLEFLQEISITYFKIHQQGKKWE
ncbi:hypothetical protein DH2020_041238 [Rehmannia glutinosa]|uniref:Glycosyl transferase family 1 domain-containing protein n=1 Tax=Rehmannia glutinosa TaxID=99300 RepID=A0ABR0URS3_REHGL